jgi:hypothetical protein
MYGSHPTSIKPYHLTRSDKQEFSSLNSNERADLIAGFWWAYSLCEQAAKQRIPMVGSGIPTELCLKGQQRNVSKLTGFADYLNDVDAFLAYEDDKTASDFRTLASSLKEALTVFRQLDKSASAENRAPNQETFAALSRKLNQTTGNKLDKALINAFLLHLKTLSSGELMQLFDYGTERSYANPALVQDLMKAGMESRLLNPLKQYFEAAIIPTEYGWRAMTDVHAIEVRMQRLQTRSVA